SPAPSPASSPAQAQPAARSTQRAMTVALVALVLAAGCAAFAGYLWRQFDTVSREAARRLQQSDTRVAQLEGQLRQAQDQSRDLQSRSAVLESKLNESLGQQAQLERMYRDIAQDSIAAVLADVESSVAIASQQLLVSGNVQGALVAMQDADGRLKRINQPEALGLRRLIARDIERLRAVPNVDVIGLALRLDTVASGLEHLPLASGATPGSPGATPSDTAEAGGSSLLLERIAMTGRRGWDALVAELSTLFRVNRVDNPDAVLLAPSQQYFVRENLRLTLLSARLAMLARIEPVFRSDLERAIGWMNSYYDVRNRGVANAVATLRQLQSSRVTADLPSLGDTLAAVRALRAAREGTP
ncbi:MAG TPA: uroporphyrinogen-III C-methyltransferase, partial [Quisquiliibacterium sp.]|nr:uroporphyrinogen-III C-methyltransferase [Quisquiliibacterium sp.]